MAKCSMRKRSYLRQLIKKERQKRDRMNEWEAKQHGDQMSTEKQVSLVSLPDGKVDPETSHQQSTGKKWVSCGPCDEKSVLATQGRNNRGQHLTQLLCGVLTSSSLLDLILIPLLSFLRSDVVNRKLEEVKSRWIYVNCARFIFMSDCPAVVCCCLLPSDNKEVQRAIGGRETEAAELWEMLKKLQIVELQTNLEVEFIDRLANAEREELESFFSKRDSQGHTALHIAAMVKSTNIKNSLWRTVIDSEDSDKLLDLLLTKDRNESTALHLLAASDNGRQLTALSQLVAEDQLCILLIQKDSSGKMPLHYLIQYGRPGAICHVMAQLSSENRSRIFLHQDILGRTVIHYAVLYNKAAVINCLLIEMSGEEKLTAITQTDQSQETAMHVAARHGDTDAINNLIQDLPPTAVPRVMLTVNEWDQTPLHLAVQNDSLTAVRCILNIAPEQQRLVMLGCQDQDQQTALHLVVQKGSPELATCLLQALTPVERAFVLNIRNKVHLTPTLLAAQCGQTDCLLSILKSVEPEGIWN